MLYLLLPPLIVFAVVFLFLASKPKDFLVRRSLVIDRDRQAIFDAVRNLKTWKDWSPWLLHEPNARLTYSEDPKPNREGGSYRWHGHHIGLGHLTNVRFEEPVRIEQRIVSSRPFRYRGTIQWEFTKVDGGTEVTWTLNGVMPFAFRAMGPMLSRLLRKDYDLGLAMLRGHLDPKADHPRIRFIGQMERKPLTAITVPFHGSIHEMVEQMRADFPRLAAHLDAIGVKPAGAPFTAYRKVDEQGLNFDCDFGIPIPDGTDPGEFQIKTFDGGRYYQTDLQGSYDYLEATWYSLTSHLRLVRVAQDKTRPSLEIYKVGPDKAAHGNEILTQIFVAVR
ncbi:SRPBCC family protein [Thioalkalicoccus limnaeus]|uniref:SRPBCC family protein n=1 Tax=Thioalkalicoccus limnaeus TaxID=120681 RepID=A0ABV4BDL1_9GAMM